MGTISIASLLAITMVVVYFVTHKFLLLCVENRPRMVLIFMSKNIDFVTFFNWQILVRRDVRGRNVTVHWKLYEILIVLYKNQGIYLFYVCRIPKIKAIRISVGTWKVCGEMRTETKIVLCVSSSSQCRERSTLWLRDCWWAHIRAGSGCTTPGTFNSGQASNSSTVTINMTSSFDNFGPLCAREWMKQVERRRQLCSQVLSNKGSEKSLPLTLA